MAAFKVSTCLSKEEESLLHTEPAACHHDKQLLPLGEVQRIIGIVGRYREFPDLSIGGDKQCVSSNMGCISSKGLFDVFGNFFLNHHSSLGVRHCCAGVKMALRGGNSIYGGGLALA